MAVVTPQGFVIPRPQIALTAEGLITECESSLSGEANSAPISQTIYGAVVGLRGGDVITGILLRNSTAAAGTSPTTARAGIADSTGTILALSANVNAAANWPVGAVPLALTAAYTILADGAYYLCWVVNGAWGTTQPTPMLLSSLGASTTAYSTFVAPAFNWTGQTDLPAVGSSLTLTSSGRVYYVAAY